MATAEDMCVLLERTGGTERALMEQQVGADQECNRSNSNVHQAAQQAQLSWMGETRVGGGRDQGRGSNALPFSCARFWIRQTVTSKVS